MLIISKDKIKEIRRIKKIAGVAGDLASKYPDYEEDIHHAVKQGVKTGHLKWFVSQLIRDEFPDEVISLIKSFYRFKQRLREKDLYKYQTLGALRGEIEQGGLSRSDAKKVEKKDMRGSYEVLLRRDKFSLVRVDTKQAAQYFGRGTKWCIASTVTKNWFDDYSADNVFFYLVLSKGPQAESALQKIALSVVKINSPANSGFANSITTSGYRTGSGDYSGREQATINWIIWDAKDIQRKDSVLRSHLGVDYDDVINKIRLDLKDKDYTDVNGALARLTPEAAIENIKSVSYEEKTRMIPLLLNRGVVPLNTKVEVFKYVVSMVEELLLKDFETIRNLSDEDAEGSERDGGFSPNVFHSIISLGKYRLDRWNPTLPTPDRFLYDLTSNRRASYIGRVAAEITAATDRALSAVDNLFGNSSEVSSQAERNRRALALECVEKSFVNIEKGFVKNKSINYRRRIGIAERLDTIYSVKLQDAFAGFLRPERDFVYDELFSSEYSLERSLEWLPILLRSEKLRDRVLERFFLFLAAEMRKAYNNSETLRIISKLLTLKVDKIDAYCKEVIIDLFSKNPYFWMYTYNFNMIKKIVNSRPDLDINVEELIDQGALSTLEDSKFSYGDQTTLNRVQTFIESSGFLQVSNKAQANMIDTLVILFVKESSKPYLKDPHINRGYYWWQGKGVMRKMLKLVRKKESHFSEGHLTQISRQMISAIKSQYNIDLTTYAGDSKALKELERLRDDTLFPILRYIYTTKLKQILSELGSYTKLMLQTRYAEGLREDKSFFARKEVMSDDTFDSFYYESEISEFYDGLNLFQKDGDYAKLELKEYIELSYKVYMFDEKEPIKKRAQSFIAGFMSWSVDNFVKDGEDEDLTDKLNMYFNRFKGSSDLYPDFIQGYKFHRSIEFNEHSATSVGSQIENYEFGIHQTPLFSQEGDYFSEEDSDKQNALTHREIEEAVIYDPDGEQDVFQYEEEAAKALGYEDEEESEEDSEDYEYDTGEEKLGSLAKFLLNNGFKKEANDILSLYKKFKKIN